MNMANQEVFIYFLHIGDNIPFYVGKTVRGNNSRLNSHKVNFGSKTQLEIIDKVSILEWKFWEKWYISLFKSWGFKLYNKNEGGGGCSTHNVSPEARLKIGTYHKGRKKPFSDTHILNLKNSLIGKSVSLETRVNISNSLKGRKITWDTRGNRYQRCIIQYTLDREFVKKWGSISEASKVYGGDIGGVLKGKHKSSKGFIWEYEY